MPIRSSIFSKIVLIVLALLAAVIVMYGYSYQTSVNVVQTELEAASLNRLSFFVNQMDTNIEQLSVFPVILSKDPAFQNYSALQRTLSEPGDQAAIMQKISLQSASSNWMNDISFYLPESQKVFSTNTFAKFDNLNLLQTPVNKWTFQPKKPEELWHQKSRFMKASMGPLTPVTSPPQQAGMVIEVSFTTENITNMLNIFKGNTKSDLFLYSQSYEPIYHPTSGRELVGRLTDELRKTNIGTVGKKVVNLNGQQYLVNYIKSQKIDWYLVDYIPLEEILKPINVSRAAFYTSLAVFLLLSVAASYLLYRTVQIPVRELVTSVQQLKKGNFAARISYTSQNEFGFLITRFNQMAEQTQYLIERVYLEEIRSREAVLKQLQSQINPHFLFNSLNFIINTAHLNDNESVIAMSHNMAEYYRYTTRVEKQLVTVRQEAEMIRNYLQIQKLQNERFQFEIDIPHGLSEALVPRLILQPIVENAIKYGIEPKRGKGLITIAGVQDEREYSIVIEDNGNGMEERELAALRKKLDAPLTDETGCGMWNVHQRLIYQFGAASGLRLDRSASGGLRVTVAWKKPNDRDKPNSVIME